MLLMDGPEETRKAWALCTKTPAWPLRPLFTPCSTGRHDDRGKPGEGQEEAVRIAGRRSAALHPRLQAALFMRALLDEVAPVSPGNGGNRPQGLAANPQSSSAHHLLGHFLFGRGLSGRLRRL